MKKCIKCGRCVSLSKLNAADKIKISEIGSSELDLIEFDNEFESRLPKSFEQNICICDYNSDS